MTPWRRWSLGRRVSAVCLIVAVLLGGLAVTSAITAATNRSQVDNLVNRVGPLRAGVEELLSALVNQETAIRGYAVTGDAAYLAPYRTGLATERRLIATLSPLRTHYPAALARLDTIHGLADGWRRDVAEPVIVAVRSRGTDAGQDLITDASRARFDEIRAAVEGLQQYVSGLRARAAQQVEQSSRRLVYLLVIAAVVVIGAGGVLLWLLNRLVARPVGRLAEQVRVVARGRYAEEIEAVGPPEVATLGRDVDAMRRKIVSELEEVRAARAAIEDVNARLESQAAELIRSNRDLEQFAYVASHDLQEPLRKVASFCQLLQRRYAGQLDERADQYIAFAVDGAQRMQRLINDLLAFSRIGRVTSGFTDVDLDRVVDEAVAQIRTAHEGTGAEITWTGLPTVRGEEPLLATLMTNLISNAVKFRRPDEPPRVRIAGRRVADEWEISCEDNGIGIEPEFADKVFVIFQRLHARDAYPGTGIGLAIAKKVVEHHGGRIWVDPQYAGGTAIRFTLPVAEEESATPAPDRTADLPAAPART